MKQLPFFVPVLLAVSAFGYAPEPKGVLPSSTVLQVGWGNPDLVSTNLSHAFVPATPHTLSYDPDGNLTNDGRFTYTWDQENRLIGVVSLTNTPADAWRKVTADYDWLGRRTRLGVALWTNSAWRVVVSNKFVYDGWSLAVELNATNNAVLRTYTWGLDLSGTLEGGGGVGGLLWVNDRTALGTNSSHFVAYDGNGNVSVLVDAGSGNETARYDYGPFGDLTRATGPMALANPVRFSSKYHDEATGLVYYGQRYYSPGLQRWLSRDPLGEQGGLNLYGFVGNDPIGFFDVNGEYTFREWAQIYGAYWEGIGVGAGNVGKAGWGLIKSPYTITKAVSGAAGTLSTEYGWQQVNQGLYLAHALAHRFREDECFRDRVLREFGQEAKEYFSDPYKLSELFAEIGVAAATAGAGAWAESAQGAEKVAKLAKLIEEFLPKGGARNRIDDLASQVGAVGDVRPRAMSIRKLTQQLSGDARDAEWAAVKQSDEFGSGIRSHYIEHADQVGT